MGQYQQWLHYQKIDRSLRATLDALEQELAEIESQSSGSLQPAMLLDNPIICTLLTSLLAPRTNGHALPLDNEDARDAIPAAETHWQAPNGSSETISAALLHWGELPGIGSRQPSLEQEHGLLPLSLDEPEIELLPDDMFAFFEGHAQTDPQLELPWWLRKITITSGDDDAGKPIDQESIRTNRLVQRWVERWGRQPQGSITSESESEGIPDAE